MSGLSNFPPGVTGNEPHLTGEYPCSECGATLPEEPDCRYCDQALAAADNGDWVCQTPDCEAFGKELDGSVCPEGCAEDPREDYDYVRDREDEDAANGREFE